METFVRVLRLVAVLAGLAGMFATAAATDPRWQVTVATFTLAVLLYTVILGQILGERPGDG